MDTTPSESRASSRPSAARRSPAGIWRPLLLIVVVAALVAARSLGLGQRLEALGGWLEGLGPLAPLAFLVLYTVAVVAALPGSALTVAAGALFGPATGVLIVSVASTLGASLSFLIARYFAREPVARWLEGSERFRRLDRMTERHGAFMVALTRLVPLFPFNLLNYGFGLTRVRFGTYVLWSWLCMLPGTVLFVVGGDALRSAIAEGGVPWRSLGALLVVGAVLLVLVRAARRRLAADETAPNED